MCTVMPHNSLLPTLFFCLPLSVLVGVEFCVTTHVALHTDLCGDFGFELNEEKKRASVPDEYTRLCNTVSNSNQKIGCVWCTQNLGSYLRIVEMSLCGVGVLFVC